MGRNLKIITLCLVALLTVGAATAGAAGASPHWTVEGKAFTGTEKLAENVTLENFGPEASARFTWTMPWQSAATCSGLKLAAASISGTSKLNGRLTLSGCSMESYPQKVAIPGCTVKSAATAGTLELGVAGELVEGPAGKTYLLLHPASGSTFMTYVISATAGHTCAISGTYSTAGTMSLEVRTLTEGKPAKSNLGVEVSPETQEATGSEVFYGSGESFAFGKFRLNLASGKSWGVSL
jgi:hypothetical protein